MNRILKITLLIVVVLPIWLTIVALADGPDVGSVWKEKLNNNLPTATLRRIRVLDVATKGFTTTAPTPEEKISVSFPDIRDNGFSTVIIQHLDESGKTEKITRLQAKLFVEDKVAVALRRLEAGQKIRPVDIDWQWREASQVSRDILQAQDLESRIAKITIQAGAIILASHTAFETLVEKGDRVSVVIKGDGLKISGVGIAAQSGSRGQSVKVMNLDSKREIIGTVTGQKEVEIRL